MVYISLILHLFYSQFLNVMLKIKYGMMFVSNVDIWNKTIEIISRVKLTGNE